MTGSAPAGHGVSTATRSSKLVSSDCSELRGVSEQDSPISYHGSRFFNTIDGEIQGIPLITSLPVSIEKTR